MAGVKKEGKLGGVRIPVDPRTGESSVRFLARPAVFEALASIALCLP